MSKNLSVRPLKCTPAVRLSVLGPMPHRGRGNAARAVKNIYNSPSAQPLAPNGAAKRAPRPPRTACFAMQYGLFCNAKRQPAAAACVPATCAAGHGAGASRRKLLQKPGGPQGHQWPERSTAARARGARHAEPSGDNGGKAAPGGRRQAKTKV